MSMQAGDTEVATIFNNLRRIFQALNEQAKQAEKQTGLTGPQLWAMVTVLREGPLRVSALAEKLYLHPATVVGILNRLEAKGLVVRKRMQHDRRVVEVELTPAGSRIALKAPEVPQGKLATGLASCSPTELEGLCRALEQLVGILDAQAVKPLPIAHHS